MKVKVQCSCGARFEFEVEPVNGQMPVAIACPACGADATALANEVIGQQLAAAQPQAAPIRVGVGQPSGSSGGLRISGSHHAAQGTAAAQPAVESGVVNCPRHPTEAAVETCRVCGKPICPLCMEQFGYVCSVYCRQQAEAKGVEVPVYGQQKKLAARRAQKLVGLAVAAVAVLIVVAVGTWVWYQWFAREPKLVYSLPIPKTNSDPDKPVRSQEYYQLLGPGMLLSIKEKHVSLFDINEQRTLWTTALQTDAEAAAIKAAKARNDEIKRTTPHVQDENTGADLTVYKGLDPLGFEDDYYFADPHVVATSNDIWVAFYDHLMRYDRSTGERKDLGIKGAIRNVAVGENDVLVLSGTPGKEETLTKFAIPGGDAESEDITVRAQAEIASTTNAVKGAGAVKIKAAKADTKLDKYPVAQLESLSSILPHHNDEEDETPTLFDEDNHPFIAAGPNVAQLEIKLLERKTISHAAMKAKKQSVLDGNTTASQGLDMAEEMMNDSKRQETGGVELEDVSRYQVTIHRRFAKDVPDWTGEVTGPPQFFPLKTVDVLTAGQMIYVFDKSNKKLWEGKLTFNAATHSAGDYLPCLETKDALYFADLGILTRYDLATGTVRWRFNSVGISHIQADAKGDLYVDSTTAGPESIQYSQQVNIHDKIHPLILKLDPETGKVIWKLESVGDHALLSGKFLYSVRNSQVYVALRLEDGPDRHFYMKLLDPATGKEIWTLHKVNAGVIKMEVQKNWILVQEDDRVLVYKFFSL